MSPLLWIAVASVASAFVAGTVTYGFSAWRFSRRSARGGEGADSTPEHLSRITAIDLKAGEEALRRAQELEARVEARTAELSLANRALGFTQFAMDNAADAVLWVSRQSRLVYVNNAACRMLGYERSELIGMGCSSLNDTLMSEERKHRLYTGDGAAKFESIFRCRDGTLVPVEITASHLVFDGSEHTCLFARDITERRRAERERAAQLQAARTLSTVSSRFVSGEDIEAAIGEALTDLHVLLGARCSSLLRIDGDFKKVQRLVCCGDSENCSSWGPQRLSAFLSALRPGEVKVLPIADDNLSIATVLVPLFDEQVVTGLMVFEAASQFELWREGDFPQLRVAARVITSGILRHKAELQTRTLLEENQRLARQSLEIQEQERANLARELHDEMGQCLTAIRADAQSICRLSQEREPRIFASGKAIGDVASRVYQVVKDIVHRLRPDLLDDLGLGPALNDVMNQWRNRHPEMEWVLTMPEPLGYLPEAAQITAYRVVQESITNVIKHAGATRVEVTAVRSKEGLEVTISDNGHGQSPTGKKGLGLLGMRERVLAAGGRFKISNQPGQGYRIQALFPLDAEGNGDE